MSQPLQRIENPYNEGLRSDLTGGRKAKRLKDWVVIGDWGWSKRDLARGPEPTGVALGTNQSDKIYGTYWPIECCK